MIRKWFQNRLAKAYLGITICMFIILFLMAGCASTPVTEVLIKTKPIEIEIAQPERPTEIKLERPRWFVVNQTNLYEFLKEIREIQSDQNPVFFAFTPQDYQKMSYNLQELRRYVLQQNEIIIYYEKMTAPKTPEEKSEEIRTEQLKETSEIQKEDSPSFLGRVKGVFDRDETED